MAEIKFGTGGWRAIIGDDFIKSNVEKIAFAVAYLNHKKANKPIIVGYDNRFLGSSAANWIIDILNASGIDTYVFSTPVPTPVVMWKTKNENYDYGIMITASHNPYTYNGIKIFTSGGKDASEETTSEIEKLANDVNYCFDFEIEEIGKNFLIHNQDDYLSYLEEVFDFSSIKEAGLKVVFNGMNGSATELFTSLMRKLDIDFHSYRSEADPLFRSSDSLTPEPTLENLQTFIKDLDRATFTPEVSIVFDGDGDRLLVLDENKKVIDMNNLMCIFYWYLHEYRHERGGIVKNLVTTSKLERLAALYSEKCYNVKVGFKWITSAVEERDALIGGESSGGFTYRNNVYGKDSIFAALFLLEILAKTHKTISELVEIIDALVGKTYFVSTKIPKLADKNYLLEDGYLEKSFLDGVKLTYPSGWVSIRDSGTEPITRLMAEASSEEEANSLINKIKDYFKI